MNVDPVPRIDPGDMPRAGDWNKLADAYNQAGIHPEHREERGAGIRHRYDPLPEFLFARVWPAGRNRSPNGSCQMYRFRAVRSHGASGKKKCETTDTEPAFTGDGLNLYAIELDDRDAPPGSIQLLRKGAGNFYEFVASSSKESKQSGEVDRPCCMSGVHWPLFRCQAGLLQTADMCVRFENGQLLNRDHECKLVEDCLGCGGAWVTEYELLETGDPPVVELVEVVYCLVIICGRLVLFDQYGNYVEGRESCTTGVWLKTLKCGSSGVEPVIRHITLECGQLKIRDGECVLIPSDCCPVVEVCDEFSDGWVWRDTGCSCSASFCAGNHLPQSVDYVATGRAGTGCEGFARAGVAPWVSNLGAHGFVPPGSAGDLTGVPGYLFTFECDGKTCKVAWFCNLAWDPDFPDNPRCFISVICDGVDCGGGVDNTCFGSTGDPGGGGFTVDFQTGGAGACGCCAGYIDVITSTPE